jgi:ADP-ribose pyrophosphatase YjhB (NUDIX family)
MSKIKAYGICLYKLEKHRNKIVVKILLCKSVSSLNKWGCIKGVQETNETKKQTAIREFYEECHIKVPVKLLTQYFEQINITKDIGIYLLNASKIKNIKHYFIKDTLQSNFLSWENSKIKFFDITKLPQIKKKQEQIINNIVKYLAKNRI